VGYVDVYRNGVYLPTSDYTATTGTTVVLTNAATAGDTITTISFYVSSVLNAIQQYNGSSTNQTLTTPTLTTPTMSAATLTGTSTFAGGVANAYGFGVGTAVPSSGAGIAFPATQSASSDANTLDDYEEGTWTPVDGSGAGLTFTGVFGSYVKIGQLVFVITTFTYPSTANTSNGLVNGLPFTIASGGDNGVCAGGWGYISGSAILQIHSQNGGTGFRFYNLSTNQNNNNLSGITFRGGFVYRAVS
jgi:hypothetical protein